MIIKESDLCREMFERTEAGFDSKNETLRGLKESILDLSRPAKLLVIALGFVAAVGTGCSTIEEEDFSVGVDCPEDSYLEVRDTEIQGIAELVCFSDSLNAKGNLEKYSPVSLVDLKSLSSDEISDEYDYILDFDVSYAHHPGREFINDFTITYNLQADPVFESIEFAEIASGDGMYMDVGRSGISGIKVSEIDQNNG